MGFPDLSTMAFPSASSSCPLSLTNNTGAYFCSTLISSEAFAICSSAYFTCYMVTFTGSPSLDCLTYYSVASMGFPDLSTMTFPSTSSSCPLSLTNNTGAYFCSSLISSEAFLICSSAYFTCYMVTFTGSPSLDCLTYYSVASIGFPDLSTMTFPSTSSSWPLSLTNKTGAYFCSSLISSEAFAICSSAFLTCYMVTFTGSPS